MQRSSINGTKLAKIIRMNAISDSFQEMLSGMGDLLEDDYENSYLALTAVWDSTVDWCEAFLKRKDELQWIKDHGFDLVFTDDPNLCSVGVVHYLGIPRHIWIASGPLHETNSRLMGKSVWYLVLLCECVFGVPPQLSYVPVLESGFLLGPIMSFVGRLTNAYSYAVSTFVYWRHVRKLNHIFREHVSADFPDIAELASKAALCFVNSDEFADVARPVLHKTIYIGGIGIDKPKPMTGAAAEAMSKGRKGVVLMAFGTTAPTTFMNPVKKKALFDAFAELSDYQFIAKINAEDEFSLNYTKNIANIEAVQWFPQRDALGHPRMRLFISHGGYNSLLESAISGVPMVLIPMFFDHFRNGKMVEYRGFGRVLERSRLEKDHIVSVLKDVLENSSYKSNAMELSKLFWSKPFRPEETLVRWTNFVLENGNLPQLVPEGVHQNVFVYYSLDILLFSVVCISSSTLILVVVVRRVLRAALNRKVKHE